VFSDFRHGIFNARTISALSGAIPEGCLRVADSQVASRWGNIAEFLDFDLITPNEREARFAMGDQDSGVRPLAERLYAEARCRWLLMKMGARGVLGFVPGESPAEQSFALDSFAGEARDSVGAGDAFLAYAALALLARPCPEAAAVLGSFAAGLECAYDGNAPIAPEQVLAKIDEAEKEIGS
jgi:sugar/nucleoside kinase (ribokinase family)